MPFKREFYNTDSMHTDLDGKRIDDLTEMDKYYLERFKGFMAPFGEYCLERLRETVKEEFETFCLLPGNKPFITPRNLIEMYKEYKRKRWDVVVGAAKCGKHPWFYQYGNPVDPLRLVPWVHDKNGKKHPVRTQDLPEVFMLCKPVLYRSH